MEILMKIAEKIADAPNTYDYAIDKLIHWGYRVSIVEDTTDSTEKYIWVAEKDGRKYSEINPLRLLGLVTIVRKYGENWDCVDVASIFSIKPTKEDLY